MGIPHDTTALRGQPPAAVGTMLPWSAMRLLRRMRGLQAGVGAELAGWTARAEAIPDPELRRQALASLSTKRFHCEGGSVFAAIAAPAAAGDVLRAIVALQTISDYLDNLSDRSLAGGEVDLRCLHRAFTDAAAPASPAKAGAYYAHHPHRDDGGYLDALVSACREALARLPGQAVVAGPSAWLAARYADLQCLKHLDPDVRGPRLEAWAAVLPAPGLRWYEAAAGCGSTLGLFALMAAASRGCGAQEAQSLADAYFPSVGALHILLDYLIDLDEDRLGGDFNFVACYPSLAEARTRLRAVQGGARAAVARLADGGFGRLVVAGLPAIYLVDRKVSAQGLGGLARSLVGAGGPAAWAFAAALRLPAWRRSP